MTTLTICTVAAALLYLIAGLGIVGGMKSSSKSASTLLRWPVLLAIVLHAYGIQGEMFQVDEVHFGFGFALSVILFFSVVILWIESLIHRLHGQFGIVLITAAFAVICPIFFPGTPIPVAEWTTLFRWHLLLALAAYSFMLIALVHAIIMTLQNRQLKSTSSVTSNFLDSMPGLVVMERIFFRIVAVGFVCLTLVLITGASATHEVYGSYMKLDHKTLLTLISWVIFGILLAGRIVAGWRAKKALIWFWIGFATLVIAYVGYSFIKEVF